MKKVAFLHATRRLKNAQHLESLLLTPVVEGLFSRARHRKEKVAETLLAAVLKDLDASVELDTIVLVTSPDREDDALVAVTEALRIKKDLFVYRIPDEKPYAILPLNQAAPEALWPYFMFPVFGAWHHEGFSDLTAQWGASVALVADADNLLMLDVKVLDKLLRDKGSSGMYCQVQGLPPAGFAIMNAAFFKDIQGRHKNKINFLFQKRKDRHFFRLPSYLALQEEEAGTRGLQVWLKSENAISYPVYRAEELREASLLAGDDLEKVASFLESHRVAERLQCPGFLEIELVSEKGQTLSLAVLERILDETARNLMSINFLVRGTSSESWSEVLEMTKKSVPLVFLEVEASCLSEGFCLMLGGLMKTCSLIQINLEPRTDNLILMQCLEVINQCKPAQRPYTVLRVAPAEIDKYASFKELVDRLLIKSPSMKDKDDGSIDFAPLDRKPCRKLNTSFYVDALGDVAACRFLRQTRPSTGSICNDVSSKEIYKLRTDHQLEAWDHLPDCNICREWYIPDIPEDICSGYLLFNEENAVFSRFDHCDEAACIRSKQYLERIVQALNRDFVTLPHEGSLLKLRMTRARWEALFHFYLSQILMLGDRFFLLGQEKHALDCWELVLLYDAGSASVGARLDQIQNALGVV